MIRPRPDRWFDRFRRQGDARLLAKVFDAVAPELWRVAVHLCRDRHRAEDAVQATFLSAIEAPGDWDAARPLVPWLLGMLANRVREQRRQDARTPDAVRLERAAERSPAEIAADREVATTMQEALAVLDEPYRSTLEQHLVHGLAAHEIARELSLPAGTVRMRLHRGLDQLRAKLPKGLVASGGAALAMPMDGLAAVRARVLGEVPGGAAVAAGSGHVASFVIGVLLMNKLLSVLVGSVLVVVVAWMAWPADATALVAEPAPLVAALPAEPTSAAAPTAAPRAEPSPVAERVEVARPAAAPRGTLRVVLHRAGDGAPVDGFRLQVQGGHRQDPGPGKTGNGAPIAQAAAVERTHRATTDDEGAARFDLPIGFAVVSVDDAELRTSIEVRAGDVTELRLEVPVRFTAELRVVDEAGQPVPDARLVGSSNRDAFGLAAREYGRTDGQGRCRLETVDRILRLRARHDGYAASAAIELATHRTQATLRLRAAPATVRGSVLDATGRPLARCAVGLQALPRERGDAAPILVWTDDAGRFVCDDVPAGRCLAVAARRLDDGTSRLAQQETTAVVGAAAEVEVRFGNGATLDAQVSSKGGGPAARATVALWLRHPELDDEFARLGTVLLELDQQGCGVARDLLPGRYRVQVVHDTMIERQLELAAGAHERFVHVFGSEPELEVRVVDLAGKPLAGWLVTWISGAAGSSETTDAEGRARFENLSSPNGRITVRPDATTHVFAEREVADATPITVVVDPAQRGSAELHGTVIAPEGTALTELRAMLLKRDDVAAAAAARPLNLAIDASTGTFAAKGLSAGKYALMVVAGRGVAQPLLLRDPVVVPAGGVVDLGRLVLGTGGLEVRATSPDGSELTEVSLAVRTGPDYPFAAPPDQQSKQLRLPAGDYGVLVWGESIAPVVTGASVQLEAKAVVPVVAARAAPVALRAAGGGGEVGMGLLKVRSDAAAPFEVALDFHGALVRGFAAGRHELEFDDLRGKRFAAVFTVGPDLARQEVVLQPVR